MPIIEYGHGLRTADATRDGWPMRAARGRGRFRDRGPCF